MAAANFRIDATGGTGGSTTCKDKEGRNLTQSWYS